MNGWQGVPDWANRHLKAFPSMLLLLALGPFPILGQQDSGPDVLAGELQRINRRLSPDAALNTDPQALRDVLARRALLLRELIAKDPSTALAMALDSEVVTQLRSIVPGADIETRGKLEGTLEAIIGDDFDHHRSRTTWYLHATNGTFEFHTADPAPRHPGASVRVEGIAILGRIAATSVTAASAEPSAAAGQQCTTIGPQNIAVLMVTTPSSPTFPPNYTPANVRSGFFGNSSDAHSTDSLNGFWGEMSYGQTSATGEVFGPIALNTDYTCDQSNEIAAAAINAADPTVDFTKFTRIALLFPVPSCSAYSGMSTLGCGTNSSPSKGTFTASRAWFPIIPTQSQQNVGLYAHELGHSLGLGHSSSDDYDQTPLGPLSVPGINVEYGDPFSVMGYPYNGAGTTGLSGHYAAPHKSLIHWLNPGDYVEVQSSGTFTIAPLESSGVRALRVLRDPAAAAWLWLEYRQPIGDVDSNLQNLTGTNVLNGALIHYEDSALAPSKAYVLDFNPVATPNNFSDAGLAMGRSWSDPYSALTLTINSATSDGLSVTVNYDEPCAGLQFSSTVFDSNGGDGTITVTAAPTCTWKASAAANWITFSGPIEGSGNGTVQFSVSDNTGGQQRAASITVQRQSTGVTQTGAGSFVLGVSPNRGSGSSGRFAFTFTNSASYANITQVFLDFDEASRCHIVVYVNSRQFQVTSGSSFCTVSPGTSSISGSGHELTVTVDMTFLSSLAGTHSIRAAPYGGSKDAPSPRAVGIWNVPGTSCSYVTAPSSVRVARSGSNGSIEINAPDNCQWNATSSVGWLTLTGDSAGQGGGAVSYSIQPNPTSEQRNGFIMIAGQAVPVMQAGPHLISLIAGGSLPATTVSGTAAAVAAPSGVIVDAVGTLYFSSSQMSAVFRLDPSGILSRIAGTGVAGFSGDGGPALNAQLNAPQGIALDSGGNLYVADMNNMRVRKISAGGSITTVAGTGSCCFSGDGGPATGARLYQPYGVTLDSAGVLYIADTWNHRVRRVSSDGVITTIAGGTYGYSGDGGLASAAQLYAPQGIAADAFGNLYIADTYNSRIRKIARDGTISTVAGTGTVGFSGDGGQALKGALAYPASVALDSSGTLYIADTSYSRIRKVSGEGVITTIAGGGSSSSDGVPATSAQLGGPRGVAVDGSGTVYVADTTNNLLRKVSPTNVIKTVVGGGSVGDGNPAFFAQLNNPAAVAKDAAGNLYIADAGNHRVRKITPDGIVSTAAGTGVSGYSGDGSTATGAQLNTPSGVAVDGSGNLYIADTGNSRIRKVSPNGIINSLAGGGSYGSTGDGGPAAKATLSGPRGLALDGSGNLYIADTSASRIRKVSSAGTITTLAGTAAGYGYSGDGGLAVNAQLRSPQAIAVDAVGNVFIADTYNYRIRKISADGMIVTVAGTGSYGFSGDGGPAVSAQVHTPQGVALDSAGNLYIGDYYNNRVRKVSPDGIISTVAGTGASGFSGDGMQPTSAQLYRPQGLTADDSGKVYVVDSGNNAIRVLVPTGMQPVFTARATHTGSFAGGQSGASFGLVVHNAAFAGTSNGTVTISARMVSGLTLVSMSGDGWSCTGASCSRADTLAGGVDYPVLTASLNIAPTVQQQATVQFSVSGGGGFASGTSDLATILPPPTIASIVNGASYSYGVVDGSWMSILGTDLSATTRTWRSEEIVNGKLPTFLDSVAVAVNGIPGAVYFISPNQLNVQAPSTGKIGPVDTSSPVIQYPVVPLQLTSAETPRASLSSLRVAANILLR